MPWSADYPPCPVEQPLWRSLGALGTPATVAELHQATSAHPNAITTRLHRWVRAGLVSRIDGRPLRYAMTDQAPRSATPPRVAIDGAITPRRATTRDRLWRAIRVLRTFDLPALMIASEASRRSTEDFVNCLHRAGYLRQTVRGNGMRGTWSSYRLARNTGARTPSISHRTVDGRVTRELVDRNSGERIDISPAAVSLRRKSKPLADGGES